MTREKAIRILKEIKDEGWLISDFEKCVAIDACDMAIKALEQEPCDDAISRKATMDAFIKELCVKDEGYLLPSEKVLYNVVKSMPSVTPTQKIGEWNIVDYDKYPFTYPKPFQPVWETLENGEVIQRAYCGERSIVAWMPFEKPIPPKAYKIKGAE